ncbi:cell division protein FtsQ/DivIB [Paenimyroides aestuarii]|uniref:Cell division protein FtsQ n=1 Tax=Paenimyroides aestuarii TaxID=2968490 RepID=A0ABY5NU05_9FLAO|nr:cell division protein FtsQ/DivIB [Paenimyroides aestuarii]UUV22070.1 cell division protein FtsQ [Paenimyroides aestuarii]
MIKKINWFDVFLAFVIAALFALVAFANNRNNARYIEQIDVKLLSSNNHFITQEMVKNAIVQTFPRDSKIINSELNLNSIENKLNKHPMIAKSEVFVDVDGKLHAQVTQKTAMARVINGTQSYYIDENGDKMPLSQQFSAHVPVVYGTLNPKNKAAFAKMLNQINEDAFLKTAITGIKINNDQSLIFTVRDYNYLIEFGHLKEIEKKFDNYKAFVHYSKNDTLIGHYKNVNLRFTEQVVCTK